MKKKISTRAWMKAQSPETRQMLLRVYRVGYLVAKRKYSPK